MPDITFRGQTYTALPAESVLDALTRHGVSVPCSCRNGVCQTCTMKAEKGAPPAAAQEGLRDNLKQAGYFLACMCKPQADMTVALPTEVIEPRISAQVSEKSELRPNILRLRLRAQAPFLFRGGQFINLYHPDGSVRSYSIASASLGESSIELHVRIILGGKVSGWLAADVHVGDSVTLGGPHGDCYYQCSTLDQPLLLIGTGTGLAPLLAVIKDALLQGHRGPIHLFHGGRTAADLYLIKEMRALAQANANLSYTPCVVENTAQDAGYALGSPADVALATYKDLKGVRVHLCGNPDMVRSCKRKAFLAGAALKEIHTDPFEAAGGAVKPQAADAAAPQALQIPDRSAAAKAPQAAAQPAY